MKRTLMPTIALLFALCLCGPAYGQTVQPTTITIQAPLQDTRVSWEHDRQNTTEYILAIDGNWWSLGFPDPSLNLVHVAVLPAPAIAALTVGSHGVSIVSRGPGGETRSDTLTVVVAPPLNSTPPAPHKATIIVITTTTTTVIK